MRHLVDNIKDFEPISLKDMGCVQLLDRTDTKFIFHSSRLPELLAHAKKYYKILQVGNERDFSYQNTYLDTDEYTFFYQHMSGKPNRYKIRYRVYEYTGMSYLEIKFKTYKNRTVKWRIENSFSESQFDESAKEFLSGHINGISNKISPVLVNTFHRLTLVGIETKERITIDYDLSFSSIGDSQVELPYLSIAELKREGFTNNSPFLSILRQMQIRKLSFSKYCIGIALLQSMPKINYLKPSLLQLNKIKNYESVSPVV